MQNRQYNNLDCPAKDQQRRKDQTSERNHTVHMDALVPVTKKKLGLPDRQAYFFGLTLHTAKKHFCSIFYFCRIFVAFLSQGLRQN